MTADIRKILNVLFSRRSRIIFLLLAAAVCGGYLYRDFRLDLTTKIEKLPDVVIHDVKLDRVINNRRWRLKSPRVETKDNVLYGDNLDVIINENDGTESRVYAKKGIFSRDNGNLKLENAKGTMTSGDKTYDMTTGIADYNEKNDVWIFSGKLFLTDQETILTGESGSFNSVSGDCQVKGGGKISW